MEHQEIKRGQAGYVLSMIRKNLQDLPKWSIPDGYRFYPMRQDDIGLWVDIQRDAEPYFTIDHAMFYQSFGSAIQELGNRCFILLNERNVGVGTVSAWFTDDFHGKPYGQVHWVALRKSAQGKGLGKTLMIHVLKVLAEKKHTQAYLGTQSARIPAIHLYLNCGFMPVIDCKEAELGWQEVRENLSHPALGDLDRYSVSV